MIGQLQYRMGNKVGQRLKDSLKREIMAIVLNDGYFYLDKQDFIDTFNELIEELNKPREVKP